MKILRYILFPFVPVYYIITWFRNTLYDLGIKTSKTYEFPVICVGNLSVGGTGKTPMIEYLIKTINSNYKIAILSRGYKRNTKGFILANQNSTALSIGDEPYQIFKKFRHIIVSVDANRQHGIAQLMELKGKPDVILLDDAFQHRKVNAGFNILLTDYSNLYCYDIVLPTGNLREPRIGSKRADVIIVTKCPNNLSESEKRALINKINPITHQQVFFSTVKYSNKIVGVNGSLNLKDVLNKPITVVTGIANPKPFLDFLNRETLQYEHLKFDDHHHFSNSQIDELKQKDFILTTEKDYVRLEPNFKDFNNLYYLPIEVELDQPVAFNTLVESFISKFK
jgi:tetraacyldisaccharide 4'-kinase